MCRVHRLPQPLPIPSLGHVNSYAIETSPRGSWVLVDPGYYSIRSLHALIKQARDKGLTISRLEAMIATHFHVDHLSLAGLLHDLTGAPLYLSPIEARIIEKDPHSFIGELLEFYREHGMPPEETHSILEQHPLTRLSQAYTQTLAPLEKQDFTSPLDLGECTLTPHNTPGHTPGHIVIEVKTPKSTLLLTGDHILPGITPHVVPYSREADQLGLYLESLQKTIKQWPQTPGYPGHREPLEDVSKRARELVEHHHQRLQEIIRLLETSGPLTAYQVAQRVRWRTRYTNWSEYPPAEKFFAMGEALAHIIHLNRKGKVKPVYQRGIVYWFLE